MRGATCVLEVGAVQVGEHQAAVGAQEPVEVAANLPVRDDGPDARLAADISLEPDNVVVRVVVTGRGRRGIIHRGEKADGCTRRLAAQLHRRQRLHDAPGVDELPGHVELVRAVQEKWPLLRKEQRVARIDHDASRV